MARTQTDEAIFDSITESWMGLAARLTSLADFRRRREESCDLVENTAVNVK